jgi:hypothetical protein
MFSLETKSVSDAIWDAMPILLALLGYIVKVIFQIRYRLEFRHRRLHCDPLVLRTAQVYYSELILKSLYNKTMNADQGMHVLTLHFGTSQILFVGVLSYLIENSVQQEFKEELMAYFFLWQHGPMVSVYNSELACSLVITPLETGSIRQQVRAVP